MQDGQPSQFSGRGDDEVGDGRRPVLAAIAYDDAASFAEIVKKVQAAL